MLFVVFKQYGVHSVAAIAQNTKIYEKMFTRLQPNVLNCFILSAYYGLREIEDNQPMNQPFRISMNKTLTSALKRVIYASVAVSFWGLSHSAFAAAFEAGKDYTVVAKPTPTTKGKIVVREFFWYGCPHCFRLEPHLQAWLKSMPKDVTFVRTPAAMNPVWEANARGYYVSEALGVRKKAHIPLFHAIHYNGQQIFDQASQAKFYARFGVPEAKFNSMFNSFPISAKIAESNKLAQQYQLTGVPAVVVNGKYVVQGEDAKVTQVMNYLIELERKGAK